MKWTTVTLTSVVLVGCAPRLAKELPARTTGLAVTDRAFHDHSWQSFVALSRPAKTDPATGSPVRGAVDAAAKLSDGYRPLWLSWKQDFEVFPRGRTAPTDWDSHEFSPGEVGLCTATPNGDKVDGRTLQLSNKVNQSFASKDLKDRDGAPLRYSVHVNEPYFNTVVREGWYQTPPGPKTVVSFPWSTWAHPERGAVVVKAAWKVLTPSQAADADFRKRFYIEEALLAPIDPDTKLWKAPSPNCTLQEVALVGLHIMHKTNVRRQWFWSSFEHVSVAADGLEQEDPNAPWLVDIKRENDFKKSVRKRNAAYHSLMKSGVWTNYRLVTTQWPALRHAKNRYQDLTVAIGPDEWPEPRFKAGCPVPESRAANVTMEAYFQKEDPTQKHLGSSCMECHYRASQFDYSFLPWTGGFSQQRDVFLPGGAPS